jgi:hypothetical protein
VCTGKKLPEALHLKERQGITRDKVENKQDRKRRQGGDRQQKSGTQPTHHPLLPPGTMAQHK